MGAKEAGPGEGAGSGRLEHAREGSRVPRASGPASSAFAMSQVWVFFYPEPGAWPLHGPRPALLPLAVGVGFRVLPLGGDPGRWDLSEMR